jgi:DNA-3-methyladenine glycosylase II
MKYLEILKKDKKLATLLGKVQPYKPQKDKDAYFRLLRAVAGQQLSTKAAATIWRRFQQLFPDHYPHPTLVIEMDAAKMREAGLSYQKAGYMKNIANFSIQHDVSFEYLRKMKDEDAITYLSSIKGVGRWTAEMLLMFSLGRKDVFPADDQGIINAMQRLYNLKVEGKALRLKCIQIAEKWKPYRSYACFYLWPYLNTK